MYNAFLRCMRSGNEVTKKKILKLARFYEKWKE